MFTLLQWGTTVGVDYWRKNNTIMESWGASNLTYSKWSKHEVVRLMTSINSMNTTMSSRHCLLASELNLQLQLWHNAKNYSRTTHLCLLQKVQDVCHWKCTSSEKITPALVAKATLKVPGCKYMSWHTRYLCLWLISCIWGKIKTVLMYSIQSLRMSIA